MSYIGQQLPADVFSGFTTDSFTGDGSATTFTLSKAPFSENGLIVVINNVIQKPTTNFTVSGTTLTIVGTAVADGDVIYATHLSGVIPSTLASKLDTNGVSDALILDADADTTISADTDDQIDIKIAGADDFQFTANTFTAQSGSTITTPTLGVINTKDLGSGIHIKSGDSGLSSLGDTDADELIIEGSGNSGLSILSGSSNAGRIYFGDSSDVNVGFIHYAHDDNGFLFGTNAGVRMTMASTGTAKITSTGVDDGATGDGDFPAFVLGLDNTHANNGNGIYYKNTGGSPDNSSHYMILCQDSTTNRFLVNSEGDCKNHDNSFGAISDERIKSNITDANSQWNDIKALKVRNFERKDDITQYGSGKKIQIGVVAQEVAAVSPGLVKEAEPTAEDIKMSSEFGTLNEDGTIKTTTGEKVKSVSYSVLYMKAIKALQEAMAKIETLETKVKALEDA